MGVSPVFVRFSEIASFSSAFWRVALALPVLFLWMWIESRRDNKPLRQIIAFNGAIVLSGLLFAGDLTFWHLAILNTTIANATLMSCLAPVWVALFSGLFIGEKVSRNTYLGLFACLFGAALLIGSSFTFAPERLVGDLYGLITSVFFGLYFLAIRVARRSHGPGALTFMSTLITAAVLLFIALVAGESLWPTTMTGIAALFALGIISHAGGQGLLTLALGSLTASFSSLVIFIEALAAAVFGWLIFNEQLRGPEILGGAFILAGIWVAAQNIKKPS